MAQQTHSYKILVNDELIATAKTQCMAEWIANDLEQRHSGDLVITIERPDPPVLQACY